MTAHLPEELTSSAFALEGYQVLSVLFAVHSPDTHTYCIIVSCSDATPCKAQVDLCCMKEYGGSTFNWTVWFRFVSAYRVSFEFEFIQRYLVSKWCLSV